MNIKCQKNLYWFLNMFNYSQRKLGNVRNAKKWLFKYNWIKMREEVKN